MRFYPSHDPRHRPTALDSKILEDPTQAHRETHTRTVLAPFIVWIANQKIAKIAREMMAT